MKILFKNIKWSRLVQILGYKKCLEMKLKSAVQKPNKFEIGTFTVIYSRSPKSGHEQVQFLNVLDFGRSGWLKWFGFQTVQIGTFRLVWSNFSEIWTKSSDFRVSELFKNRIKKFNFWTCLKSEQKVLISGCLNCPKT